MATIKAGFSRSKAGFPVAAWAIMACEHTDFSHSYVKIPTRWGFDLVYHAVGSGVNFSGPCAFELHHQPVEEYEIEISDEARDKLLEWCARNSGLNYSRKQVFGMLIKRVAKLFGSNIRNPFSDSQAYICTELVAKILESLGYQTPVGLEDMGLVETKQMLVETVSAHKLAISR